MLPSLDRYGRSLRELINMAAELRERGIGFPSLHENPPPPRRQARPPRLRRPRGVHSRTHPPGHTKEGLNAARGRGRVGGRPTVATEEVVRAAYDLLPAPGGSITSIAKLLGVSPGTCYNHIPDPPGIPGGCRDIADAVPGARLRIMPGVGHFLVGDVWATYAEELRAFARRAAEPPPATGSTPGY